MANYNFLKEAQVYMALRDEVEPSDTVQAYIAPKTAGIVEANYNVFGGPNLHEMTPVIMAGEAILPTIDRLEYWHSNLTAERRFCLFECGNNDYGTWIGIDWDGTKYHLLLRCGEGSLNSNEPSNDRIWKRVELETIPEFDDKAHTVCWYLDPLDGAAYFWIDKRLVLFGETSDGSSFAKWTTSNENSGAEVGWGRGIEGVTGQPSDSEYETKWPRDILSYLRIWNEDDLSADITNFNLPKRLEVASNITFNQTFTNSSYSEKTLHDQTQMYDKGNIKFANPANFSFTIGAVGATNHDIIKNVLTEWYTEEGSYLIQPFDLYVKMPNETYAITNAIMATGKFVISQKDLVKLEVSGEASRLSRGTLPKEEDIPSNNDFFRITESLVRIAGADISGVVEVTAEIQNEVKWNPYKTVHGGLQVENYRTTMYPSKYSLSKRIFSGTVTRYVTDTTIDDVQEWNESASLLISAGENLVGSKKVSINLPSVSWTNRVNVKDVFTQTYDWKMNNTTSSLNSIIEF